MVPGGARAVAREKGRVVAQGQPNTLGHVRLQLFNRAHAMFPLAYVVASPIAGLARESDVDLEPVFLCVCAVLVGAALIETTAAMGPQPITSVDSAAQAADGFRSYGFLLMVGIVAALGAFQEMAVQTWSAIFMESVLRVSAGLSSLAPAAFTAGLSVGRFAAHLLEGKHGDVPRHLDAFEVARIGFGWQHLHPHRQHAAPDRQRIVVVIERLAGPDLRGGLLDGHDNGERGFGAFFTAARAGSTVVRGK